MNAFEAEIQRSCIALDLYYRKLPVPSKIGTANGKTYLIKLDKTPFDGFIVYGGRFVPLEMKSQVLFGSFPLSNIEEHQIIGLKKMIDLGCVPYLLINQRRVEKEGKKVSRNRAWAIDFRDWDALIPQLKGRKSIPAEFFENGCNGLLTEIPRIHAFHLGKTELVWDIRILV